MLQQRGSFRGGARRGGEGNAKGEGEGGEEGGAGGEARGEGREESGEEGWGIVNARRANVEVASTPRRRVVMIKMSDARERERARDASDAR